MELCGINSFCFASRLLNFRKRWMHQKTNEDEDQAVMALLKGLRSNVDFTDVASGFHSEKAAFFGSHQNIVGNVFSGASVLVP